MAGLGKYLRICLGVLWVPRQFYLTLAVAVWIAGYFLTSAWYHHQYLRWLWPIFFLNGDLLFKTAREVKWLWLAGGLLGYQMLSRLWSPQVGEIGGVHDVAVIAVLLLALVTIGRQGGLATFLMGIITLFGTVVTLYCLFAFYGDAEHTFTSRFRNPLMYELGLNPVLTGMMCCLCAMVAMWHARRNEWRLAQGVWLTCVLVLSYGVIASGSRGAMLAAIAGMVVLAYELRKKFLPAAGAMLFAIVCYVFLVLSSETGVDLVERGSTGRFTIYEWFLERMSLREYLVGRGIGADISIPEEELGWFVDHPHSSYVSQLVMTGVIGLGALGAMLAWALHAGWTRLRSREAVWVALLASGATALLFDCGQILTIHSAPRIEFLMLMVPAALLIGRTKEEI